MEIKFNKLTNEQLNRLPLKDQYRYQMALIEQWFNSYYTEKEQKYNRLMYLGKTLDDGTSSSSALLSLYELAEEKRKQYQDYEKKINEILKQEEQEIDNENL